MRTSKATIASEATAVCAPYHKQQRSDVGPQSFYSGIADQVYQRKNDQRPDTDRDDAVEAGTAQ